MNRRKVKVRGGVERREGGRRMKRRKKKGDEWLKGGREENE